ncbi:MAG: hypothetical protein ACREOY_09345 [Candidatus Dormibacteraceae bacterium]
MFIVRWAATALLVLEAVAAALYSFLLASVAVAYWQVELTSRQAAVRLQVSWLDVLTQSVLLVAVVVIYVVVPAAIAVGAARRRRFWWLWAGAAYELGWAVLLAPVIVGLDPDLSKVGFIGAILFGVVALADRRRRPRRAAAAPRRRT